MEEKYSEEIPIRYQKGREIVRVSLAKVLLFEATVRLKVFRYNCIAETMLSLRFFGVCSRF